MGAAAAQSVAHLGYADYAEQVWAFYKTVLAHG
jgi:hypothetical protein